MQNGIEIKNLNKSFGEKHVLRDVNAFFEYGKTSAIMAPSGFGKSTLFNVMMGIYEPDTGSVSGVPEKMSAVFQDDRLVEEYTVLSNVRMAAPKAMSDEDIVKLLNDLGIGNEAKNKVKKLSGGMKRRVAIARALAAESDILFLDEPFAGLDENTRMNVIRALNDLNKTILLVTHDIEEARLMNAKIYSF